VKNSFDKILNGYQKFRNKYVEGDRSIMQFLSDYGQRPQAMVVACCDSRVDPALILQCDPGDLFVVRNVANIVPPFEKDDLHHGTSAALEFGIRFLGVKHLILLGHSQCGGVQALLNGEETNNDFISNWVSLIKTKGCTEPHVDEYAKSALFLSYQNCLTFPWIKENLEQEKLIIHLWFFDIKNGQIFTYSFEHEDYIPLDAK
jgi:carbonic anhydrase